MNELTLGGKIYVSSKRAAEITGYAKDYIGQLCREGRVQAQLVGRNWYILESAIREHRFGSQEPSETSEHEVKTSRSGSNMGWESPRYVPEVPKMIPIANVQANIDAMLSEAAEDDLMQESEKRSWGDVQGCTVRRFARCKCYKRDRGACQYEQNNSRTIYSADSGCAHDRVHRIGTR
jgi:hypothetical protein